MKKLTGSKRKAKKSPSPRRRRVVDDSNNTPVAVRLEIQAAEKIATIAEDLGGETNIWGDNESTTFSGGPWHDEFNESLWPWDPDRPVVGQYEAYVAHMARGDAMLDEAMLTPTDTAAIIAQSSDSYAPRATAWEVDGPVRGTADAKPRVAVPVATGPEPEHGVEVEPVDCPREECAAECTAPYGACVVETEEPK